MQNQTFIVPGGQSAKWIGSLATAAAAGLGVQNASADVVHHTVDAVINSSSPEYAVDFRGDSNPEFKIHYDASTGLVANKIPSAGPYYYAGSITGQIKALSVGDTLDPSDPAFIAVATSNPLLNNGGGLGEFTVAAGEKFIGVKLNAGEVGWIGFQVLDDSSSSTMSAEVYDFAYETSLGKAITIPEPTSLGLLALGAIGLAAYRRRSRT